MAAPKYEQIYTDDNKGLDIPAADTLNGIVSGRPMFASVDIDLQPGQKVLADGQTLLWMDGDMKMDTGCFGGGCCAAMGRKCSGESCCMNMYTGGSSIGFGFTVPGDMMSFGVTPGEGWILSQNAFIAGTQNLRVSGKFAGCWACCCGGTAGEGLFLTHVTSGESKRPGMFFAGGFGSIVRHDIPAGQVLYVDNGLFFAAHEKTKLRLALVTDRECCSCTACCSGEGIVMRFTGPAMVFTQSRDPSIFIPPKSEKDDNRQGASST